MADCDSARPIASAGLHVTSDAGAWPERVWESTPATVTDGVVRATLPEPKPLVAYLTIEDNRGVTVSAEHAILG